MVNFIMFITTMSKVVKGVELRSAIRRSGMIDTSITNPEDHFTILEAEQKLSSGNGVTNVS